MNRCQHHVNFEGQRVDCNLPEAHPGAHRAGIIHWYPDGSAHSCYEGLR